MCVNRCRTVSFSAGLPGDYRHGDESTYCSPTLSHSALLAPISAMKAPDSRVMATATTHERRPVTTADVALLTGGQH